MSKWPATLKRNIPASMLALPALVLYGLIVNPTTGHGGIPCLWHLIFNLQCPGCGLSRADALFIRGHVGKAAEMNWLIVPIYLIAAYCFIVETGKQIRVRRISWHN